MQIPIYRITVKGQVTIPKEIRDALYLREGDGVIFTLEEGRAVLYPAPHRPLADLRGAIPAQKPYPGEEAIEETVRRQVAREAMANEEDGAKANE